MESDRIKNKLSELHLHENGWNKEISILDATIKKCEKEKIKLAKKISNNMKYRNLLLSNPS
jgi:hypothetical protein